MGSKSSNTKNAALHMQFLILNWRPNDCKCDFMLFYSQKSHAFVYLLDGNDLSLLQILTQYSEHPMVLVINISPKLNTDF